MEVNYQQFNSDLIIGQNFVFKWEISNSNKLSIDDFLFLKYVRPYPDYIIIVDERGLLNEELLEKVQELQPEIKIDILEKFIACSTFNSCA